MAHFDYLSIRFRQREETEAPAFCIFCAPVGELLCWSAIKRLEPGILGIQRQAAQPKVKGIARFLGDPRNTIPPSVVITIDAQGSEFEEAPCTVPLALEVGLQLQVLR